MKIEILNMSNMNLTQSAALKMWIKSDFRRNILLIKFKINEKYDIIFHSISSRRCLEWSRTVIWFRDASGTSNFLIDATSNHIAANIVYGHDSVTYYNGQSWRVNINLNRYLYKKYIKSFYNKLRQYYNIKKNLSFNYIIFVMNAKFV